MPVGPIQIHVTYELLTLFLFLSFFLIDSKSKNSVISSLDCLSSIVQRITTEPAACSHTCLDGSEGSPSPPQSGSEDASPLSSDSCGTTSGDPSTNYQVL